MGWVTGAQENAPALELELSLFFHTYPSLAVNLPENLSGLSHINVQLAPVSTGAITPNIF